MMIRMLLLLLSAGLLMIGRADAAPVVTAEHTFHIIDDRTFVSGFDFHADAIQAFLDEHGSDCDNDLCLKDYRDPETGESAATIIATTSQELAINPRVILITLQKENSLITAEEPEAWNYRTAMGYGCPDNADCEADFFGFANQVRLGATLLRVGYDRACGDKTSFLRWRVQPRWYRGNVTTIDGRATLLGSCATAALYNYTPHRVDSAWRPATDGFLYYGNYNFVYYLQEWFDA